MLIKDIAHVGELESNIIAKETVDMHELISNIEWSFDHKIKDADAVINENLEVKHIFFSKKNLGAFCTILFLIPSNIKAVSRR